MSGIGFTELIVLFVIGLLILGPERLPRVATQIGRWVGKARRTANQLRYQLEREIALADIEKKSKDRDETKKQDEEAGSSSSQGAESGQSESEETDTGSGESEKDRPAAAPSVGEPDDEDREAR